MKNLFVLESILNQISFTHLNPMWEAPESGVDFMRAAALYPEQ